MAAQRGTQAGDLVLFNAYPGCRGQWAVRPRIVIRTFPSGNVTICAISGPGQIFPEQHIAIGANPPPASSGCRHLSIPANILASDLSFILLAGTFTSGVNTPSPTNPNQNWFQPLFHQGNVVSIQADDVILLQSMFCDLHFGHRNPTVIVSPPPPPVPVYFAGENYWVGQSLGWGGVPPLSGVPGGVPGAPRTVPGVLDGYLRGDLDEDGVTVKITVAKECEPPPTAEVLIPPSISPSDWEEHYGHGISMELPGPDPPQSLICPLMLVAEYKEQYMRFLGEAAGLPP